MGNYTHYDLVSTYYNNRYIYIRLRIYDPSGFLDERAGAPGGSNIKSSRVKKRQVRRDRAEPQTATAARPLGQLRRIFCGTAASRSTPRSVYPHVLYVYIMYICIDSR